MTAQPSFVDPTWPEAVKSFLRALRLRRASPNTIRIYTDALMGPRTLAWVGEQGIRTVGGVDREKLRTLCDDLMTKPGRDRVVRRRVKRPAAARRGQKGTDLVEVVMPGRVLNPTTFHMYYRAIRTFVQWCIDEDYPVEPRLLRVPSPPIPDTRPEAVSVEDQEAALRVALTPRDRFLLRFMAYTGLRVHEVVAVTIDDIKRGDSGYMYVEITGKGRKHREVPLDTDIVQLSRELRHYIRYSRPTTTTCAHLFLCRPSGEMDYRPMQTNTVRQLLKRLSQRAGLKRLHPHQFRHACGTSNVERVGPHVVQKVLGHSDIRTTMRYVHHDGESLARQWAKPRND